MLSWLQQYATFLASLVVSVCALGLAVWQGIEQRRHNRKSVLPQVDPFVQAGPSESDSEAGFYLRNSEIGPARLTGIGVSYKGSPLRNASELMNLVNSQWPTGRDEEQERYWHTWAIRFDSRINHLMLQAGQDLYILKLRNESWKKEVVAALRSILKDIEIRVSWESVYGERFEIRWSAAGAEI